MHCPFLGPKSAKRACDALSEKSASLASTGPLEQHDLQNFQPDLRNLGGEYVSDKSESPWSGNSLGCFLAAWLSGTTTKMSPWTQPCTARRSRTRCAEPDVLLTDRAWKFPSLRVECPRDRSPVLSGSAVAAWRRSLYQVARLRVTTRIEFRGSPDGAETGARGTQESPALHHSNLPGYAAEKKSHKCPASSWLPEPSYTAICQLTPSDA